MKLSVYIFFYFLILFSILGHGIIFKSIFFKKNNIGLGYTGILGILSLTVISYISIFFISHNLFFNSFLFLLGLFVIIIYFYKNILFLKKDLLTILFLFLILIVFILTAKNHDDFPYYHFSYIHLLTSSIQDVGIGNFNHGFRTPSSIFYFASLFYLPLIEYDLVHIMPVFFLGFSNFIYLKKIKKNFLVKDNSFIIYLSIFNLALINIFFYRLAEHGTDRSAQILILLIATEILEALNYKSYKNYKVNIIFLMIALVISLKVFYLIYLFFLIPIFYLKKNNFNELINTFFNKITYFCIFFFLLLIFVNFINTGCLIYPLSLTCLENVSWAISINEVKDMNIWYQLWAKAGSSPSYTVENPDIYIQNLNWLNNWFNNYFLNKISDFILAILFLITILGVIFKSKKLILIIKVKKNTCYYIL